jgi:ABC-type bacteriocin/lantibiotic exporter with double-glycine peptidase domain
MSRKRGVLADLAVLWRALPAKRRAQGLSTLLLMFVASIAEILSVASVVPFLAILTAPDRLADIPVIGDWAAGLTPGPGLVSAAALLFIGLFLVSGAIRLQLAWTSHSFAFRTSSDVSAAAFRRIDRQPYEFYISENSGDIISKFEKINIITYSVLLGGVQAITSSAIAALLIAFLILIDPLVAIIAALVVVGSYVLTSLLVQPKLARNSVVIADSWAQRIKRVQEALGGIRDILLDRSQAVFERDFERNASRLQQALAINAYISIFPKILVEMVAMILVGGLAWYFARQPAGIIAAIPTLGALAVGAQRLMPLLQSAYFGWSQFLGSKQSLAEVAELLEMPEPTLEALPRADWTFDQVITLSDLSFAYEPGRPVLCGIDLSIAKGQRFGIAGESGSGKSTLTDLLLGLFEPTSGSITVDGMRLEGIRRLEWQSQVAHVPQSVYLADDSLAANIAFGVPPEDIDMDLVEQAARAAGIDDTIRALPGGYQTIAGERGARLSGGQRQRIGIARALYKRAQVLVLDEATSALDPETAAAVMQSIADLPADVTVVVIAHQSEMLDACDQIICLKAGRIDRVISPEKHISNA